MLHSVLRRRSRTWSSSGTVLQIPGRSVAAAAADDDDDGRLSLAVELM